MAHLLGSRLRGSDESTCDSLLAELLQLGAGGLGWREGAYIRSIMASPNSEHDTSVAPSIRRAKS